MIMNYYDNNNDNKFILMWFIDVNDNVQCSKDGEERKTVMKMIHLVYLMVLVNHFSHFKILKTA